MARFFHVIPKLIVSIGNVQPLSFLGAVIFVYLVIFPIVLSINEVHVIVSENKLRDCVQINVCMGIMQ